MLNLPPPTAPSSLNRYGLLIPPATPPLSPFPGAMPRDHFTPLDLASHNAPLMQPPTSLLAALPPQDVSSLPLSLPAAGNPWGPQSPQPPVMASASPTSDETILGQALHLLGNIRHLPQEEAYLRQLGLSPCFRNGQEALKMIQDNHIQVVFGDMGDSPAHAQWVADQRTMMVNQKYRGDNSPATLYAISEAIYHEAGHAANVVTDPRTGQRHNLSVLGNGPTSIGDDQSSLQEELDCMALNSLAHGYHEAIDPAYAKAASTSRLLHDGVQLYYRFLLHDPDPYKNAIINRMVEKYGELPLSSPGHEPPSPMEPFTPLPLAYRIAQRIQQQSACPTAMASTSNPETGQLTPTNSPKLGYWA